MRLCLFHLAVSCAGRSFYQYCIRPEQQQEGSLNPKLVHLLTTIYHLGKREKMLMLKTKADIFKRESCFVLNIYQLKPHHHLS